MKNKTTTFIVSLTLALSASVSAQNAQHTDRIQLASSLYSQGLTAMKEQNYAIAESNFKEAVRLYPKHTHARKNLLYLLQNRKALEAKKRKSALKQVIIPSINLEQVTLQEALDVLDVMVRRESKQASTPNFLIQDPADKLRNNTITLKLNQIPAETVLNYIADQAGAKVRHDTHAIILSAR